MSKTDKFKAKARELSDKLSNTGSVIGGIKGLFRGYDQISDKPKGFHGFQSSGGFQGGSSFNDSSQGFANPSVSAGGAPQGKFSGFGSGMKPPSSSGAGSSPCPWESTAQKSKKSKKSKKEEKFYSSSSESEEISDTEESDSSEDEETRKAREKEERRKARKEQKKAAAAAAAAEEDSAKAERKEARRAKKEAKLHGSQSPASPVPSPASPAQEEKKYEDMDKAERKEYRRLKREAKRRGAGDELKVGEVVLYKNKDQVTIKAGHYDDVEPYYTVTTKSGREKQTPLTNLTRIPASPSAVAAADSGHDFSGGSYTNDVDSLQKVLRSLRESLGEEWVQEVSQRFETMAGDNHLIGIEQFRKVCEEWSWTNKITGTVVTFPANECEGLFRSSDRNGDGFIDIREFLLGVALAEVDWKTLEKTDELLQTERAAAMFRMYDEDRSGVITLQQLIEMLKMLHRVCGSEKSEDEIASEARQVIKVLPTGTFLHGVSLPAFVKAVKRKDIFTGVSALLEQGFTSSKCAPGHSPGCAHSAVSDELDELADDFAQKVEFNTTAPTSLDDLDTFAPSPASMTPASVASDGSKLDMSSFFSPAQDSSSDASKQDSESDGYEDLLA
eukprot:TRINITY_DN12172_c0_g1_i1.p1 TRINITY_DN12172_c0_g1~~TRINITY_DN12172_c0_g1_i1.p1  ORF type:complete len:615 (+),score=130.76 TRINITY_DN12172_c0_g1_i1:202-2046(+)